MSVAWYQTITPWSAGSPATSGSFTAVAGDALLVFCMDNAAGSRTITFSGTGTYSRLDSWNDSVADTEAIGANSSASSGSQTMTVAATSGDGMWGWAYEYSGVASISGTINEADSPGTGTGAITGTSVTVPSGGILIALCVNVSGGSDAITSPSGTNRGSGANAGYTYCATEYAGTGGAIQPSFTSANGSDEDFVIMQFTLSPAGGGVAVAWWT